MKKENRLMPYPATDGDIVSSVKNPERALLAALLYRSILDYSSPIKSNIQREAKTWIFRDSSDAIFSFDFVCSELDVNPWAIRQAIKLPDTRRRIDHMRFYL